MAEELKIEPAPEEAPAIKCSYCGKIFQDEEKHNMGFETDNWAICFKCFKKICDKVGAG